MKLHYLGTHMPYVYEPVKETPPPEGYVPFYINYLGRHGVRYLENPEGLMWMNYALMNAEIQNGLKPMGEILKRQIEGYATNHQERYRLLNHDGMQMIKGIVKRMYETYPNVFGREVHAVSTNVERTKQSKDVFLGELSSYTEDQNFTSHSYGEDDPILRFFDLNRTYLHYKKEGKWKDILLNYQERNQTSYTIANQLIKDWYMQYFSGYRDFVSDLFDLFTNGYADGKGYALGCFFDEKQLAYLHENNNLKHYLLKGPSSVGNNLPTNISFGLLLDFIKTSEEAITIGNKSGNFRFAHAETIIPFASMLEVPFAAQTTNAPSIVKYIWKDYNISPLAANVVWIFYRKKGSSQILVKMKYNEKEVKFPVKSVCGPYCNWNDLKAFYMQKLVKINAKLKGEITNEVKWYHC